MVAKRALTTGFTGQDGSHLARVCEVPHTEVPPFHPRFPCDVGKVHGHFITLNYRESFDMNCSSDILLDHEMEELETAG